jgi:hypothetical protein
MLRLSTLLRRVIAAVSGLLLAFVSTSAAAHVKWFSPFSVEGKPTALHAVINQEFLFLAAFSMIILTFGGVTEGTKLGLAMARSLDRATGWIQENTELMFRAFLSRSGPLGEFSSHQSCEPVQVR